MDSSQSSHDARADRGAARELATSATRSRDRSLQVRLVMIVVVVCSAVWLSTLFDTLRDRSAALHQAERQHDNVAGALAEQAARSLQATDLILQQAALLDPGRAGSVVEASSVPELLRRHMSGVPQVRNLFLFDPERHLHLSASLGTAYLEISDRPYFTAQRDQPNLGLYLSEPFISRTTGDPTFVLSRRLPGPGFRGIVGASVETGYFRRFYNALQLGPGGTVELIRADGTTLVDRERLVVEPAPSGWSAALHRLEAHDASHTVLDHPLLGLSRVSLRRVPGYPAVIAVGRAESEILADWRREAWSNVTRTFVITGLAALLLVAFLRQLERHERITAQLHQSQKLEALGTLAGGIAHDFNNILGAVLGYGELASQSSAPGTEQRRYVDNIVTAANRARDLVARILAFSRPGVGRRGPTALQDIITEITGLMRASLPVRVAIDTDLPPEPLVVLGDGAQLHQVVGNLVTNAVQAMPDGGRVSLALKAVDVSNEQPLTVGRLSPGRYARFDVHDSGVGIAQHLLPRIFDPFFTTKAVGEGTGLGLSLVHGIVLEHGGGIGVESEPGRGTTFSVFLPIANLAPGIAPPAVAPLLGDGQTILIVDDEPSLVSLAEEVLASIGYEPVGCVGARNALACFRTDPNRFDAVLCDVIMPDMQGPELAVELRSIRPTIPIILMSGYGGASLQARADAAGAQALLQKPLRSAELARCLADLFHARSTGVRAAS